MPYIITIVTSLILYFAGIASGIFISRVYRAETRDDIKIIQDYVDSLRSSVEDVQVQQTFFNIIGESNTCAFIEISMDDIQKKLEIFWKILPYRIEDSQKIDSLEYSILKRDYTFLSLRAWLITKKYYIDCNHNTFPILYFYSSGCHECIKQGESLDKLKDTLAKNGKRVIAFTIDINQKEPSVDMIVKYYNVSSTPAIIMPDDTVMQGKVFGPEHIISRFSEDDNDKPKN